MTAKPRYYVDNRDFLSEWRPHMGHAYEVIATDAIARFMRLDGYDVFFLTGTDEHGQKIQQTAAREGLTARELVERNVPRFKAMVERMNCSNDDFIRTTEERHYRASEEIWKKMEANGDIYLSKYAGWYSMRDERYYAEDETRVERTGHPAIDRDRHAGGMGGGGELLLPPLRLSGKIARAVQAARLRAAARTAQRSRELCAWRPAGPVDLAHDVRLGRAGAGQSETRDVCVGRRADQLHHSGGLSGSRQLKSSRITGRPTCM